jgi:molybdopterin-binding protein
VNILKGHIIGLTTSGNLTLVEAEVAGVTMTAITIGSPEKNPYLLINRKIDLLFNESEVSLGKDLTGLISMNNQIDCLIENLERGEIFTRIFLSFGGQSMRSLITTRSAGRLALEKGDRVTALIKTNEVFLREPEVENFSAY